MAATDILRKSPKGEMEIKATTSSISMKQRSLLVMIDGKSAEADYLHRLKAIGNVQALIQDLETAGYIERVAAPPQKKPAKSDTSALNREAQKYMAEFMYSLMGPEGETTALRIERCRNNSELYEMVDMCRETIAVVGNPGKAEEFSQAVKSMLE